MRQFRSLILLFLFLAPVAALSALRADDLPSMSKWYFHADFKQMRSSEAGQHLYAWLQDEVFEDIREDAGVDLDKEADFLTAFATEDDGMIIVIEGNISQESEDKIVAMGGGVYLARKQASFHQGFGSFVDHCLALLRIWDAGRPGSHRRACRATHWRTPWSAC